MQKGLKMKGLRNIYIEYDHPTLGGCHVSSSTNSTLGAYPVVVYEDEQKVAVKIVRQQNQNKLHMSQANRTGVP